MQQRTFSLGRISAVAARHPWRVIVVWVVAMAAAAVFGGPKLWQVTTNDTSHFLPNRYESVRATQFGQAHFGQLQNATAVAASSGAQTARRSPRPTGPKQGRLSRTWRHGDPTGM